MKPSAAAPAASELLLEDGSRVAVLGGGPAGSLFAHFLLDFAGHMDMRLEVDLWEPKGTFGTPGPQGCNMCGGIVSETLVQNLAVEGVALSTAVVQRGIDSYVLHTDVGSTRIATPLQEMRIGALHRGPGPKAAARAAVFSGISASAFERHYLPVCRAIASDNRIGRLAFLVTRVARGFRPFRRGMVRMVAAEQSRPGSRRRMSGVLWDMFSGSAPYADIFLRMITPGFLGRFLWATLVSFRPWERAARSGEAG